jgi:hypothetical protein
MIILYAVPISLSFYLFWAKKTYIFILGTLTIMTIEVVQLSHTLYFWHLFFLKSVFKFLYIIINFIPRWLIIDVLLQVFFGA